MPPHDTDHSSTLSYGSDFERNRQIVSRSHLDNAGNINDSSGNVTDSSGISFISFVGKLGKNSNKLGKYQNYWLIVVLAITALVFSNTLQNGFVFDDHYLIENNVALRQPGYIQRVFKPWPQDSPVPTAGGVNASFQRYYRPLTRGLFALQYQWWGLDPRGWHLVNLALYLLVVGLAGQVLYYLLGKQEVAAAATLLFALHPLHSEVVGWTNCLVETLHGVFFLGATLCYLYSQPGFLGSAAGATPAVSWAGKVKAAGAVSSAGAAEGTRQVEILDTTDAFGETNPSDSLAITATTSAVSISYFWRASSVLLMALAMFSKETAIVFPGLVAASVLFVTQPSAGPQSTLARLWRAGRAAGPYMVVVVIYLLLRWRAGGGQLQLDNTLDLSASLKTLPSVVIKYATLLIWPVNLSPTYPLRPVTSFGSPLFWGWGIGLLLLIILAVKWHAPRLRWGGLLLVLPLAPLLNTSMLLPELLIQDRYLFLSSLGFALILGSGYDYLLPYNQRLVRLLLLLVLALYSYFTVPQNAIWRDDSALFMRGTAVDPTSALAHSNLGAAYMQRGAIVAAEREYLAALQINPDHAISLANLANIRSSQERWAEALVLYQSAIVLGYNSANVYYRAAIVCQAQGDFVQAVNYVNQALAQAPGLVEAQLLLGQLYEQQGRRPEAIRVYQKLLTVVPTQAVAKQRLKVLQPD
jgi:tetratricopeptide (TPR) repeat protein